MTGTPFVTIKEKVFEKSDPFCHSAELTNILHSNYSNGVTTLEKKFSYSTQMEEKGSIL